MTDAAASKRRPAVRVGILSHGTSQFDSRAHRVARSLAAAGDTVTLYSRHRPGLPLEEMVDGYRVVRIAVSQRSLEATKEAGADTPSGTQGGSGAGAVTAADVRPAGSRGMARRMVRVPVAVAHRAWRGIEDLLERIPVTARFLQFPVKPWQRARWFADQVEPHDVWHGMWAQSLPVLRRVARRHGGRTVYDSRDVFLRARGFASMPRWQRAILSRVEGRWARGCDAVVQVSEQYAAMMERDLGLRDVAVVRNCPDRWDPPEPRPDRLRQSLGIPSTTSIVLYQGLLIADRGIEQAMDAILDVPDAVLVLMGFGNQNGSQADLEAYRARAARPPHLGRVILAPAVPPQDLLTWTASADISIMLFQPTSENHDQVTPQKLWEAMAAGTPVLASDLPGFRTIVTQTGCGRLVDPTDPAAVAQALRELLALGPDGLRAVGDAGLAAAHATYNWERQFEVLDQVYARILATSA
jgi:glycosyltransferase involved in cell wall biosynthesis